MQRYGDILKNSSSLGRLSDFEIILQKCSLGDPFKNCLKNCDLSRNMARVNGGFLHCVYGHDQTLENALKRRSDFEIISYKCSFVDLL